MFRNLPRSRKFRSAGFWLLLALGVMAGWCSALAARAQSAEVDLGFDKVREEDRVVLAARFEKEVWPLLVRSGNDGCVGCHHAKQARGELAFSGKADPDFRMLLRNGFLLPKDPGGMLHAVSRTDARRRMPPGNRPAWTAEEIDVLRGFVLDVEKRQQK